jgi:hypothetical protein
MAATPLVAAAASLGGIYYADLFAWSSLTTVPIPTPVAEDDFACNGALDGQTDSVGNTWTDHGGNWSCIGGSEVRAGQRVSPAHATVDVGVSDGVYITVNLTQIVNRGNSRGPGIALLSNGASHLFVIYERIAGQITLGKWDGSGRTALASANITDRATAQIRVEITLPQIRVLVDGATVLTYTMTAGEVTAFGANTRFGLAADQDNWSRFDYFLVEVAP